MKKLINLSIISLFIFLQASFGQDVIFWGSQTTNTIYSLQELSGSVATLNTGQQSLRRIQVDPINNHVFWAAGGLNTISRSNFDGSNKQDIITNATDVGGIAVYPEINALYYYSRVTREFRVSDLNGNNNRLLFNLVGNVLGISFDKINNQIYWNERLPDGSSAFKKADLPLGSNTTTVFTSSEELFDIFVSGDDSTIYFTNRTGQRLQKIDFDGNNLQTLVTETSSNAIGSIDGNYCDNTLYYNFQYNNASGIRIRKTDLDGSTFTTVLDTNFNHTSGIGVLFDDLTIIQDNFLGPDQVICQSDSTTLIVNGTNNQLSYLWNDGSTNANLTVKSAGIYWCEVTKGNCSKRDSIQVNFSSSFSTDSFLGNDTTICEGDSINLDLSLPGFTYAWSDGSIASTFTIKDSGIYWVDIQSSPNSCPTRDSIIVALTPTPSFSLGNDTMLCANDSLRVMNPLENYSYLWNTGESSPSIAAPTSGIYWLRASIGSCSFTDSISVLINPNPELQLGRDTALCFGDTLTLDAFSPSASYLWSNGSIDSSIRVNTTDLYRVTSTLNNCTVSDSVLVTFIENSSFTLGNDTSICQGENLVLSSNVIANNFLWQDLSTNPTFTVVNEGIYYLSIQNICGNAEDSIQVNFENCNSCAVEIPNVFTPNNDFINDKFKLSSNCQLTSYSIQIYNRWGRQVFQSRRINNSWSGRSNGIKVQNGNYSYILRYQFSESEQVQTKTGHFLLIE